MSDSPESDIRAVWNQQGRMVVLRAGTCSWLLSKIAGLLMFSSTGFAASCVGEPACNKFSVLCVFDNDSPVYRNVVYIDRYIGDDFPSLWSVRGIFDALEMLTFAIRQSIDATRRQTVPCTTFLEPV